ADGAAEPQDQSSLNVTAEMTAQSQTVGNAGVRLTTDLRIARFLLRVHSVLDIHCQPEIIATAPHGAIQSPSRRPRGVQLEQDFCKAEKASSAQSIFDQGNVGRVGPALVPF